MAIKIEKGQMMASSSSTRSTASDGIGLSNQIPRQASGKIKTPVFKVDEPTKQKAKAKVTRAQKASTIDIAQGEGTTTRCGNAKLSHQPPTQLTRDPKFRK
ncbi:hypothetical protein As57867_006633, partial [Aphanomyces stellatus]